MKKMMALTMVVFCMIAGIRIGFSGEKAPEQIVAFAESKLATLGLDPIIIDAVNQENAKNKSLSRIQEMDAQWKSTPGIADYMQAMMDSACGKRLRGLQKSKPYYSEIFVMDNQGANVAMTDKTSDYWQGDEAKFQKSFNGGKGAVFVDEVEFDDSTKAYLVQVSVPVLDNGKVIGAITFGIDVDKIE